jgi:hypothetical protein
MLLKKFPWIDKIEPLMEFLKEHGYDFSCGSSITVFGVRLGRMVSYREN